MPNLPDLPRELRDHIYKFCLVDSKSIPPWRCSSKLATGLLRVNKTVHREANLVFYSQNIFDFSDAHPDQVARLLDRIGPANAAQICHIIVTFPYLLGVHARPPCRRWTPAPPTSWTRRSGVAAPASGPSRPAAGTCVA
ncbi:uncharacterized protein PG986_010389 [Apiospora aurea]|uniref:F-box domain-containing protein n=1 Tax=Apiospora aurea TaxID=335848 RepID=A0ABR1Q242_9PEZI